MSLFDEVFLLAGQMLKVSNIIALSGYILDLARIGQSLEVTIVDGIISEINIENTEPYNSDIDPEFLTKQTKIKTIILTMTTPKETTIISSVKNNKIILNFYITKNFVI